MNYINRSQVKLAKQKGVVLITSLIFLILILLLVRFSLSESQLQERKSGVDIDIARAMGGAKTALRIAEEDIFSRHTTGYAPKDCSALIGPAFDRCLSASEALRVKDIIDFWKGRTNNLTYIAYANALPCVPIWNCTDWGNNYRGRSGNSITSVAISDADYVDNLNLLAGQTAISPRYIIESIDPVDQLNLGTRDPATRDSVTLRVTAVGFGLDDGSGAVTNAMLQATYILKP